MAAVMTSPRAPTYQALSSDTWPTTALEGAQLYVVDLGETYVFYDGLWCQRPDPVAMLTVLGPT
jgi:hypothetical protein